MKKYNLLFIQDTKSNFDSQTKAFDKFFIETTIITTNDQLLNLLEKKTYDIILQDLSVEPNKAGILKKILDENSSQIIFALVDPKDTKKLYGLADMGVNAFELIPEQFDSALEMIAQFDPNIQY